MARKLKERVIPSGGNVFADMGLNDAAELDTKARLGAAICHIVERRRLSQAQVAEALGVNQPKVSALLHYKLEGFSVERLLRFLVVLGQDVEILVRAKPRSRSARIAVRDWPRLRGRATAGSAEKLRAVLGKVSDSQPEIFDRL